MIKHMFNNPSIIAILLSCFLLNSQANAFVFNKPDSWLLGRAAKVTGAAAAAATAYVLSNWRFAELTSEDAKTYYGTSASTSTMTLSASALMRFPHMYCNLIEHEDLVREKARTPKILVLGAGNLPGNNNVPTSPMLHELAAVFPKGDMEIVDLDPRVQLSVKEGFYNRDFFSLSKDILSNGLNFARPIENGREEKGMWCQKQLTTLVLQIPSRLEQLADAKIEVYSTFFEFHNPKTYDYIIATKSLLYPLNSSLLWSSEKEKMIKKYLNSLRDNGRMYVDFGTWKLMQRYTSESYFNESYVAERIPHQTAFNTPHTCTPVPSQQHDYIGCLKVGSMTFSTTEDIVLIKRKL